MAAKTKLPLDFCGSEQRHEGEMKYATHGLEKIGD